MCLGSELSTQCQKPLQNATVQDTASDWLVLCDLDMASGWQVQGGLSSSRASLYGDLLLSRAVGLQLKSFNCKCLLHAFCCVQWETARMSATAVLMTRRMRSVTALEVTSSKSRCQQGHHPSGGKGPSLPFPAAGGPGCSLIGVGTVFAWPVPRVSLCVLTSHCI